MTTSFCEQRGWHEKGNQIVEYIEIKTLDKSPKTHKQFLTLCAVSKLVINQYIETKKMKQMKE